jgi:uncharacterized membrane-anchored protein
MAATNKSLAQMNKSPNEVKATKGSATNDERCEGQSMGKFLLTVCAFGLLLSSASAQENWVAKQVNSLAWQSYPSIGSFGSRARITLSNDIRFLDQSNSRRFLELNGNPPRDNQYTLAPRSMDWFAVFAFDPIGFVKDDERLDPNELLRILRQQNEAGIEERRRLNLPILRLDGWAVPPHYDTETHYLEWGTRLLTEDSQTVVNYTIRILGRSGVMNAILVSEPQSLDADIRQFKNALRGFDFVAGERYAEFRQGDRMAEYGLTALIVGGAAAAAAKPGAMKGFGKLIGIGVLEGLPR